MPPKKKFMTGAQMQKMRQKKSSNSDPMDTDSPPPSHAKSDVSSGSTHRYGTRQSTNKAKPASPTETDPMDEDTEESTPTPTPAPKEAKPASPTESDLMEQDSEESTPTPTRAPPKSSPALDTPSRYPIRSRALISGSPARSEPVMSAPRRLSGLRAQTEVPDHDSEEDAPYDFDDDPIPTPIPENMDDGVKIDDSDADNTYDPEDEPEDDGDGDSDTIVVDVKSTVGRRPSRQPGFSIPKPHRGSARRHGHSQRRGLPRLPTGQKRLPGQKPLPSFTPTFGRPALAGHPVGGRIPFVPRPFNPQFANSQASENVTFPLWAGAGSGSTWADVYFRMSIGEYHLNLSRQALKLESLTGEYDIRITAVLKCEDPNEPGKDLYLDVIHACKGDDQASWKPKPPSGAANGYQTLQGWINTSVASGPQ